MALTDEQWKELTDHVFLESNLDHEHAQGLTPGDMPQLAQTIAKNGDYPLHIAEDMMSEKEFHDMDLKSQAFVRAALDHEWNSIKITKPGDSLASHLLKMAKQANHRSLVNEMESQGHEVVNTISEASAALTHQKHKNLKEFMDENADSLSNNFHTEALNHADAIIRNSIDKPGTINQLTSMAIQNRDPSSVQTLRKWSAEFPETTEHFRNEIDKLPEDHPVYDVLYNHHTVVPIEDYRKFMRDEPSTIDITKHRGFPTHLNSMAEHALRSNNYQVMEKLVPHMEHFDPSRLSSWDNGKYFQNTSEFGELASKKILDTGSIANNLFNHSSSLSELNSTAQSYIKKIIQSKGGQLVHPDWFNLTNPSDSDKEAYANHVFQATSQDPEGYFEAHQDAESAIPDQYKKKEKNLQSAIRSGHDLSQYNDWAVWQHSNNGKDLDINSPGVREFLENANYRDMESVFGENSVGGFLTTTNLASPAFLLSSRQYEHENLPKEVSFHPDNEKLFEMKHLIKDHGGQLDRQSLKKHGYDVNQLGINDVTGDRHITTENVDSLIKNKSTDSFKLGHTEWDSSLQNHAHETELNHVMQFNLNDEQRQALESNPHAKNIFDMVSYSSSRSHPVSKGNTVGWARYSHRGDGIHIDEIQTDFSDNTYKGLMEKLKTGSIDHPDTGEEISDSFKPEHFDALNEILFGKHKPSQKMHSAFLQAHRDMGMGGKQVHIWNDKSKASISLDDSGDSGMPVHMKEGYGKIPKKMGYKPAKYGDIKSQSSAEHTGKPTWAKTLKKSRARKALDLFHKLTARSKK